MPSWLVEFLRRHSATVRAAAFETAVRDSLSKGTTSGERREADGKRGQQDRSGNSGGASGSGRLGKRPRLRIDAHGSHGRWGSQDGTVEAGGTNISGTNSKQYQEKARKCTTPEIDCKLRSLSQNAKKAAALGRWFKFVLCAFAAGIERDHRGAGTGGREKCGEKT